LAAAAGCGRGEWLATRGGRAGAAEGAAAWRRAGERKRGWRRRRGAPPPPPDSRDVGHVSAGGGPPTRRETSPATNPARTRPPLPWGELQGRAAWRGRSRTFLSCQWRNSSVRGRLDAPHERSTCPPPDREHARRIDFTAVKDLESAVADGLHRGVESRSELDLDGAVGGDGRQSAR